MILPIAGTVVVLAAVAVTAVDPVTVSGRRLPARFADCVNDSAHTR